MVRVPRGGVISTVRSKLGVTFPACLRCVISRSAVMRFVFPVVGLVFAALLFVNLLNVAVQYERIRSVKTLSSTPDMTSSPVLAPVVETQSAVEAKAAPEILAKIDEAPVTSEFPARIRPKARVTSEFPAKIEPAARAARAEAQPTKKRVTRERRRINYRLPFDGSFSIKGY